MKRLRSFGDGLDSSGERNRDRDRDRDRDRYVDYDYDYSSSRRRFCSKPEIGRREDDRDRESSRRKRSDYDLDVFERRKSSDRDRDRDRDRYRESSDRGVPIVSPRNLYASDRIHHSGFRRDFPKGYVSERDRTRREESVSSWRRLSGCKDVEAGGSRGLVEERLSVRSPRGFREVSRSPRGPKEITSSPRGSKEVLMSPHSSRNVLRSPQGSKEVLRSPHSSRDIVKSPPGSRDSCGEQSKSCEVKSSSEVKGESSSSSEMEEGELEPECEPEPESELKRESVVTVQAEIEDKSSSKSEVNFKVEENEPDKQIKMATSLIDESQLLPEKQLGDNTEAVSDESLQDNMMEKVTVELKSVDGLQECHEKSVNGLGGTNGTEELGHRIEQKNETVREDLECSIPTDHIPVHQGGKEEMKDENANTLFVLDGRLEEKNRIDSEVKGDEIDVVHPNELAMVGNRNIGRTLSLMADTLNVKDKGKSIAISSSYKTNARENSQWVEKDLLSCKDDAIEGPSTRGFELFSRSSSTRFEKTNYSVVSSGEKLKTEPLDLSLGLSTNLLPNPIRDSKATPSSPGCDRSIQSLPNTFHTSSDGFSGSMSFSGSQTFIHNPSCSLTQNSIENCEQSVGSRPIFQGINQQVSHITWPGKSLNEPKLVESPNYQRLIYGNGSHPSQTSEGIMCTQFIQEQQRFKLTEGSTGIPVAQDQQSILRRQFSVLQSKNHIDVSSPTNSVGSLETRSDFSKDRKPVVKERNSSQYGSSSQSEVGQLVSGGDDFVERTITMIVSEPVQVMYRRIEEMTVHSIAILRQKASEIISNKDQREQLHAFQEALQNRSDLTVETLSKAHQAQLEIIVALKTGLQDYLKRSGAIPSHDLAEIYHNLRCRNVACLSLLPVDDCDCKVCVQKSGFCSACMCLICSKFDSAQNTCSWVGCDVCLHWCHTDCGLRKSYIKNGSSLENSQEPTEMQFHCVACNHPSEMFGFVKDVFKTCAKEWEVETFSKEFEYVKRIFSASNDRRGKQLHTIVDQLIARLKSKSSISEVYNHIMRFLTEPEKDTEIENTPSTSLKEVSKYLQEDINGVVGPVQVATWLASACTDNIPLENNTSTVPPRLDWDQNGGRPPENLELQISVKKTAIVDELESIVRIKQAEANMFQARADDARKEAEGLKRIAVAKSEKIDEEYSSHIMKLRLMDADEKCKQKLDELKVMEREHREYFNLKMRMESDIRVLLLKMEAAKQKFST